MRRWMFREVDYTLAGSILLTLFLANVIVIAAFWKEPVNVSENASISDRPAIAVGSDGQIHLVWADTSLNYPSNSEILYRSSTDGGATWSPAAPINLSNSAERSLQPEIAVAGNDQRVVAWADDGETYARRWDGSAWTTPVQLSSTTTPTLQLSAAINEAGVALVAWTEGYATFNSYAQVPAESGFYRRWDGSAWAPAQSLAARLVALHGNLAYLATENNTLLRSDDAGQSWSDPISLPARYQVPDDMKLDSNGTLHMAWISDYGILSGSYDGLNFSTPAVVDSWAQYATDGVNPNVRALLGTATSLALSVNSFDQLGLIWSSPSLESVTSNYGPLGVNNRSADAVYRIMSSQSINGQSWTLPAMQSEEGGFPALAAAPDSTDFYGAWRSPGETPDVFVAVNQRPEPRYRETFKTRTGLFANGIDVVDGTAQLNGSNPLDWPLFGASQNYGSILRGQDGEDKLLMLDDCLSSFNVTTGQIEDLGPDLCVPFYTFTFSNTFTRYTLTERMMPIDQLAHDGQAYILSSVDSSINNTTVYTPNLLIMDTSTGTIQDAGHPTGTGSLQTPLTDSSLAADPSGSAIYIIVDNQLYRYDTATDIWSNLNQTAQSVTVVADGTVYVGDGQRLLSSSNGGAFVERVADFSTATLHSDSNGCIVGFEDGRPVSSFEPSTSTDRNSTATLERIWYPRSSVSSDSNGATYFIDLAATPPGGQLLNFQCSTGTLEQVLNLPQFIPSSSSSGGLTYAGDNRIWMVLNEIAEIDQNPTYDGLVAYSSDPLQGEVVSAPIFSGSGDVQWGTLTYSATVPAGASFGVDVLDAEGNVLRSDLTSGTDLSDLPAEPLRLRARMQAPDQAATPTLDEWQLAWQPIERRSERLSSNQALTLIADDGNFTLEFPAGAVQAETTVTYTEQLSPSQSLGSLRFAGRSFSIVATSSDGSPVTSFEQAFTLTINYSEADLQAAGINEADLDLVYWDGSAWVSSNPTVDQVNNQLVVSLDHLTEFALVAQGESTVYLPLIERE